MAAWAAERAPAELLKYRPMAMMLFMPAVIRVTTNFGWPLPAALLAGAALGFAAGVFLALVTLRMNPLVAGLTTLAFGETMVVIAFNIDYLGGANSFIGIPLYTTFDIVYLVLAIIVFAGWRFDRSRLGYAARACRDNAVTAAAMGINVTWVKTLVFALGGAIAGIGGVFRAHYILVQNPDRLSVMKPNNARPFTLRMTRRALWAERIAPPSSPGSPSWPFSVTTFVALGGGGPPVPSLSRPTLLPLAASTSTGFPSSPSASPP